MKFTINPREGIAWNGHCILFGDTQDDVRRELGEPDIVNGSFYYFQNELRFDFDAYNTVEFIEFLGGTDGVLRPQVYDMDVFSVKTDELFERLKWHDGEDITDNERDYSYAFRGISIGLYRESTPGAVEEMIAEMKNDGLNIENSELVEEERRKAFHWATIGLGRPSYYR